MISSTSVSSFYPKRAGKPPKKAPAVPKPAGLSKLPRAIVALLASSVGADSTSPVTGTSTTSLTDGGYVVTWSRLDGSISSRAFSPDGSGGFVAGTVTEVVEKSTEPLSFPGALISGQISPDVLPDQIPVEKLPIVPDSKLETVSGEKITGTVPASAVVDVDALNVRSAITINGEKTIQWVEFSTPLTFSFTFSGRTDTVVQLPSGIDAQARYILADVFVSANKSDHINIVLGRSLLDGDTVNWVIRGQDINPNTRFGDVANHAITVTHDGDASGTGPYYGMWYSSQHIPILNGELAFDNYSNSDSNGHVYFVIKAWSY